MPRFILCVGAGVAVGGALYLYALRQRKRTLRFWTSKFCPYAQRVAIALAENALPHEVRMIDLSAKPEEFVSLYKSACPEPDAKPQVPLIEINAGEREGRVMVSSLDICEYLLTKEGAADDGRSPVQRESARRFASSFQKELSGAAWVPILLTEPGSDQECGALEKLRARLRAVDALLQESEASGPFLLGNDFSIAEIASAPFALRLAKVLPALRPTILPDAIMATEGLTRLREWFAAVCARPSCAQSLPPVAEVAADYSAMIEAHTKAMKAKAAEAAKP